MGATCGQVRRAVTAEHPSSSAADWDTHSTVGAACVDCETVRVCPHEPVGADRIAAVSRAIEMMRKRLEDRHTLEDIARTALLSPFHFHRVFREVTATTPGRFLTALRLAEAKRLLVESDMRVTDICITVGYSSLGSFTTQFTRLVGMPPRRFRTLATRVGHLPARKITEAIAPDDGTSGGSGTEVMHLSGDAVFSHGTIVGLFAFGVPQQRPVACAVTRKPGNVQLPAIPDGRYEALALGFADDATARDAFVGVPERIRVGAAREPVTVRNGCMLARPHAVLHAPRAIDPPLLFAPPYLGDVGV